ncbi:MAG TPA: Co2+/Mg2+ efflux protein ApaG [Candidatus Hydrogenedentes bacterium]|nr:Co2+/Mg2+ efflux protein ApaG [Candidatus Hydrogenedentota bacterium]
MSITTSDRLTEQVRVQTQSYFEPEQSDQRAGYYHFGYRIRISNHGDIPARLISRHWIITDGLGRVEEVKGEGVVGKQPRLKPGDSFEYESCCPLYTRHGTMRGVYHMRRDDGSMFDVEIGAFTLWQPALSN